MTLFNFNKKRIEYLEDQRENLILEIAELSLALREQKKEVMKDEQVMLANGRARFWYNNWAKLYHYIEHHECPRDKSICPEFIDFKKEPDSCTAKRILGEE